MALILSGSVDVGGSMTATTVVVSAPGAGGMVSSSQQIQNYNLFAVTSSANTFYGNQTITGSLDVRGTAGNGIKLRHSNGTNIAEINELSGVQGAGLALKNSSGTQNILFNAGGDSYINGGNLGLGTASPLVASGYTTISVNNTTNGGILDLQQNGTSVARFGNNGTSVAFLETRTATPITISTNDTQRIHITSGGTTQVTGSVDILSSGANGIIMNADSLDGNNSSRLFFTRTGGNGWGIFNNATGLSFRTGSIAGSTSGAEVVRFGENGDVIAQKGNFVIGIAGNGIDFSTTTNGSGTVNSELLNDYEEGTWTPTIRGSSTAGTYTLTGSTAYYTKIGNQVTIYANAAFSAASGGTGYMEIASLPFTYKANTVAVGQFSSQNFDFSAGTVYAVILPTSSGASTNIFVSEIQDNGASTEGQISGVTTSTSFRFTFTYTV